MSKMLYEVIEANFNLEELAFLCASVGVKVENLGRSTLRGQALELTQYMERRGQTPQLLTVIARERPALDLQPWGGSPPSEMGSSAPSVARAMPEAMAYRNFDIRIHAAVGEGRYPIEVTDSPEGQSRDLFMQPFPIADEGFQEQVRTLTDLLAQPEEGKRFGRTLRDLLFPPPIWSLFTASRAKAKAENKGLRIRLRIGPSELSRLPWEYCYDDTFHYFALSRELPIVRYLAEPFAAEGLSAPEPVRVLVALASPAELAFLNVEEEAARIVQALGEVGAAVEVRVLHHATRAAVQRALVQGADVFHFVGHGLIEADGGGSLAFESESGNLERVDADQLRVLMQGVGIRVVVLNACQSAAPAEGEAIMGLAPALVRAQIPAVIAMQFPVPDDTALAFTRDLYSYLALGLPLDRAVTEMRLGAYTGAGDKIYWGIPVLFMRAPDGVIWQPRAGSVSPRTQGSAAPDASSTSSAPRQGGAGQSGGVNISVTGGSVDVKGDIVGGNKITGAAAPSSSSKGDLLTGIQALRAQLSSLAGTLDAGALSDIESDLGSAEGAVNREKPNFSRAGILLNSVMDALDDAADSSPQAKTLRNEAKRLMRMAETLAEA